MDSSQDQQGNRDNDGVFYDSARIQNPISWEQLLRGLHKAFAQDIISIDNVRTLMSAYKSNPEDWEKYAMFDKDGYTHNLVVDVRGKFNLMVLCWNSGTATAVHNHADSHCFYKVLDGKMKEEKFDWPEGSKNGHKGIKEHEMIPRQEQVFTRDQSNYISDEIGLHRMKNASHEDTAVTLHLYSPPYTLSFDFDQRNGQKHTNKLVFWSRNGKRTPHDLTQDEGFEMEN